MGYSPWGGKESDMTYNETTAKQRSGLWFTGTRGDCGRSWWAIRAWAAWRSRLGRGDLLRDFKQGSNMARIVF